MKSAFGPSPPGPVRGVTVPDLQNRIVAGVYQPAAKLLVVEGPQALVVYLPIPARRGAAQRDFRIRVKARDCTASFPRVTIELDTCNERYRFPVAQHPGVLVAVPATAVSLERMTVDAMLAALDAIVKNEGPLGNVLSQGSERAAATWGNGADEFLITSKGAEAPAHMPQAKRSLGLIYAVNPFGADHQSSEHDPYYEEGVADLTPVRLPRAQDP